MGSSLSIILVSLLLLGLGQAVPLHQQAARQSKSHHHKGLLHNLAHKVWEKPLSDIKEIYPGIYWDLAHETCSEDQFKQLVISTELALEMTRVGDVKAQGPAWDRYFVHQGKVSAKYDWYDPTGWGKAEYSTVYEAIANNIQQVGKFPIHGPTLTKSGKLSKARQIAYTCKEPNNPHCSELTGAYTIWPPTSLDGFGNMVVFCQAFWGQRTVAQLRAGKQPKKHDLYALRTREQSIIHEWMHCNAVGYAGREAKTKRLKAADKGGSFPVIVDVEDPEIFPVNWHGDSRIYNDDRCHTFAWKYAEGGGITKVNPEVAFNADSYAWYFASDFFHHKTGWGWDTSSASDIAIEGSDRTGVASNATTTDDSSSIRKAIAGVAKEFSNDTSNTGEAEAVQPKPAPNQPGGGSGPSGDGSGAPDNGSGQSNGGSGSSNGGSGPSNGGSGPSNGGSGPSNGGSGPSGPPDNGSGPGSGGGSQGKPDANVTLDGGYLEVNASDLDPLKTKVENCYHQTYKGQDIIRCDYVGMPYQDYAQATKGSFISEGGCTLNHYCWHSVGGSAISPKCQCTCDGKPAGISDKRCRGFAGQLPNPPKQEQPP